MKNAQEIMEACMALVDLDVPGHAIAPILRWLADQMEQPAQTEGTDEIIGVDGEPKWMPGDPDDGPILGIRGTPDG